MILSKLKSVAVFVLLTGVLAAGAGALTHQVAVDREAEARTPAPPRTLEETAEDQPPAPQPPPPAPMADRLEAIVQRLHETMEKAETLSYQVVRTTHNKTFGSKETYVGTVRSMKPNLFVLELAKKGEAHVFDKFVCDGKSVYHYRPLEKVVLVHELPRDGGRGWPWLFEAPHTFFFGMSPKEAQRRYQLKLAREDQWYIYVEVTPRLSDDKQSFKVVRVVLLKENFLPRQLWYVQPNDNEVTFDFPKVEISTRLKRDEFTPSIPQGWRRLSVPRLKKAEQPGDPGEPQLLP